MLMRAKKTIKPYIIPTIYGVAYLFLIVNIFAMSYYRDSGPLHTIGLTLIVLGMVAMIQTNANIQPVSMEVFSIEPGPAHGQIRLTLVLRNTQETPLYNLYLQLEKPFALKEAHFIEELGPSLTLDILVPCMQRGIFPLRRIRVGSRGYYGLFHAWKWVAVNRELIVYPQPKGHLPLPIDRSGQSLRHDNGEDFLGHRPYVEGHSLKHVDWKAYARGQPLLSKDYALNGDGPTHLAWKDVPGPSVESRLEQLCAWVMSCAVQRKAYSFEMPHLNLEQNFSQEHLHASLQALASYKETG